MSVLIKRGKCCSFSMSLSIEVDLKYQEKNIMGQSLYKPGLSVNDERMKNVKTASSLFWFLVQVSNDN